MSKGSGLRALALALAGVAVCFAASVQAQTTPGQSLTITPQMREQRVAPLSDGDRRALEGFSSAPSLTPSQGLSIGRAYGPNDEDCVRAGGEVFCRQ